jgi:Transcriptional regulator, AbiEi antitoxin
VRGSPDARIARIAERQRGLVTSWQLRALGLSRHAIARRRRRGRLHQVHTHVFAVGHSVLAPLARETAALLECGVGSLLSHATALDASWSASSIGRGGVAA